MSRHIIEIPALEALPEAAEKFIGLMGDHTVFAFNGEMGAGKTTFISALSRLKLLDFSKMFLVI